MLRESQIPIPSVSSPFIISPLYFSLPLISSEIPFFQHFQFPCIHVSWLYPQRGFLSLDQAILCTWVTDGCLRKPQYFEVMEVNFIQLPQRPLPVNSSTGFSYFLLVFHAVTSLKLHYLPTVLLPYLSYFLTSLVKNEATAYSMTLHFQVLLSIPSSDYHPSQIPLINEYTHAHTHMPSFIAFCVMLSDSFTNIFPSM